MNQHYTEVVRESSPTKLAEGRPDAQDFRAICSCGWEGRAMDTYGDAADDGDQHVIEITRDEPLV